MSIQHLIASVYPKFMTRLKFIAVNLRSGYQTLEIRSPKDLINYED